MDERGKDTQVDHWLEAKVKSAYDDVQLKPESYNSMLDSLMQIHGQTEAPANMQANGEQKPIARRKHSKLRIVLPTAACLVVALVVGGVALNTATTPQMGSNDAASSQEGTMESPSAENTTPADSSKTGEDGAASVDCPLIELDDGTRLEVQNGQTQELSVEDEDLQYAHATSKDGTKSQDCWVFDTGHGDFFVTFDHSVYYPATRE